MHPLLAIAFDKPAPPPSPQQQQPLPTHTQLLQLAQLSPTSSSKNQMSSSSKALLVGPKRALAAISPSSLSTVTAAVAASPVAAAAVTATTTTATNAVSAVVTEAVSNAAASVVAEVVTNVVTPSVVATAATTATSNAAVAAATSMAAATAVVATKADGALIQELIKKEMFSNEKVVGALTAIYFGYVVLGGINHDLHHHIYTGDENESVFQRLMKMKPVVFREEVYDEFFSFKHYFTTYRIHVLMAGIWLVSGAYNLRNTPTYAGRSPEGKALFDGWFHARASGYTYAISSFLKGVTATIISLRSHSLGWARYPMALYGVWDIFSLYTALDHIRNGRISEHKEWMIRNFSVGAGSIWVRVFGAIWALFDLDFMKSNDMYRKMNNVILFTGFTQGVLFGEYWLAKDDATRQKYEIAQIVNVILTVLGAFNVYHELRQEAKQQKEAAMKIPEEPTVNRKLNF